MTGAPLAIAAVGLLAVAGLRRGSAARSLAAGADTSTQAHTAPQPQAEHWALTTLTGDEVFAHVTRPVAAASILRQGFRSGRGRYGPGVYLLPPEKEWGHAEAESARMRLPPSRTPAQQFRLRWHPDERLSVLRVRLPAGTRLLRVGGPEVVFDAHDKLEGRGSYRAALQRRPTWEDGDTSRDALLADLAAKHGVDGLYVVDIFDQGEVLVFDPSKIEVLREQMQR